MTGEPDVHTATETARQLRGILGEITDPDSEITASAATRRRLEGAAIALEATAAEVSPDGSER